MTKIASIALALALATTPASASIYTSVGFGFCMPAEGEYSYMKTSGVSSTLDCSARCDETNATGQHPTHHYRGFTRVRAGNDLNLARNDCICFYDGHKLPALGLDSNDWTRHEPEGDVSDGVGRVADSDGTAGIHCYEILVEESVSRYSLYPHSF